MKKKEKAFAFSFFFVKKITFSNRASDRVRFFR